MCDCLGGNFIGMGWFGNIIMLLLWSSLLAASVWLADRFIFRRLRDREAPEPGDDRPLPGDASPDG